MARRGRFAKLVAWISLAVLLAASLHPPVAVAKIDWRALGGVLATVGAVAAVLTANPGAGLLAGIQVTLLGGAAIGVSGSPPPYAGGSAPVLCPKGPCPAGLALGAARPVHVTPAGSSADVAFITAGNVVIDRYNDILDHPASEPGFPARLAAFADALEDAADAYDATDLDISITDADVAAFQAACATGTCPAPEPEVFTSAGLSPGELQAVTEFLATVRIDLQGASVSLSDVLHEEAAALHASFAATSCPATKKACAAKLAKGELGCVAKSARLGLAPDPACVAKAVAKFDGSEPSRSCFASAERDWPCLTVDDADAIESAVTAFVADVDTDLGDGRCAATQTKCVAKMLDAEIKCHVKAERPPGGVLDPACVAKAEAKGVACVGKAETKGPDCVVTGVGASLAAKVAAFTGDLVCRLDPLFGTCP